MKLWGSENVVPRDISLAKTIHDDELLAVAGTLAKQGERIKDMYLTKAKNDPGIYAVKLYLLGDYITVVIDDNLAFMTDTDY